MHDYKLKTTGIAVNINTGIVSYINPGIGSFSISAVNDKEAWCGGKYGFGRDLILLQTTGKVKKKVKLDTPLYDITVTPSGDVFFSEDEGHTIKMYSSEKFTVIANTTPYKTQGLFITIDQDLLVCLYFDGRKNDNSKVVRMSLNGQIIQTLQYNKENTPLFNNPQLVTENINGDICVVDTSKTVVAVNKDGEFRFKYPESNTSSHTFRNCYGIACDKLGYILISDFGNNRIHQIDSDGKFVQFILTVQHCLVRPWGLSIGDDGQLWVCNKGGSEVRVFIFRSSLVDLLDLSDE
ncbi:hypothetical protein KUTeg_024051 [Tegillarca granosa]|uniref:Uncharacterized protein n=1 Tax=Tegillarca granosa TaxID=220873 RepID=A0ABQ9E206_TEGGR|nr:hypothetical protein KUTeg_024051 [Tegillarca granosa]